MLAYNLINFFKEEVLTQRHMKQMTQTIRERLFLIPGRLIRTCLPVRCTQTDGRWVLKLERTWYYKNSMKRPWAESHDMRYRESLVSSCGSMGEIYLSETLSNLLGKWINKLKVQNSKVKSVVFEDGEEVDIENLDYKLIKPLIWW